MTDLCPEPDAESNRRRYFRIDDAVHLTLTPIPADAEATRIARFAASSGQFSLFNELRALRQARLPDRRQLELRQPLVASGLDSIERQIDQLAQAINTLYAIPDTPNLQVELSAQGLGFETDLALHPGMLVEAWLVLLPERNRIEILARVVKSDALASGTGARVVLDFAHLRESDREAIIHHVHLLQMHRLQARHRDDIR